MSQGAYKSPPPSSSPVPPVIIIGSGAAGLSAALALAPCPVVLMTKTEGLAGGSTPWAQGGIAAALADDDSPLSHYHDTLAAGAGLCDPLTVHLLTHDAPRMVAKLLAVGMPFDRRPSGCLAMAREAAHSHPRVVHAGGDSTGHALADRLIAAVRATPSIQIMSETVAVDLLVTRAIGRTKTAPRVGGVLIHGPSGWGRVVASGVVLATGGMGMAWQDTTNPPENTGDGLAMAARAQALLADLEFMQFHPTALAMSGPDGSRLPLLTEALRGAGACLINAQGHRIMDGVHVLGDLAPRDVVARAVGRRRAQGEAVFLDIRPVLRKAGADHFPQVLDVCRQHGLDPLQTPLPVTAAAHYHMGGVVTDSRGRSSLNGLWACGEVACTGANGANRLASNSLLEALVFADRVATDITLSLESLPPPPHEELACPVIGDPQGAQRLLTTLRCCMSTHVGLIRTAAGLRQAATVVDDLTRAFADLPVTEPTPHAVRIWAETRSLLTLAPLIIQAAQDRRESRGAHARSDFPQPDDSLRLRHTACLGHGTSFHPLSAVSS